MREAPSDPDAVGRGGTRRLSAAGALLVAVGVLVLLALAFLWIPHWILAGLPFGSRSLRVGIATGWVGGAFCLASYLAWRTSDPRPYRREKANP